MTETDKIKSLITTMSKADKAYYNNHPFINDSTYDDYYFKLKKLHTKYPHNQDINHYFATMHQNTTNNFTKRKQLYNIRSLDKIRTAPAISHFLNKWNTNPKSLWYTKNFLIESKQDGISSVFYINDDRMPHPLTVLTRGSGVAGADITAEVYYYNYMDIRKIMKRAHGRHFVVRGELLINHKDFRKLNQNSNIHYKNCRNLASGSVMNKDPRVAGQRGVFLSAYTLVNRAEWTKEYPTELSQMKLLRNLGFHVIKDIHLFPNTAEGKEEIIDYMMHWSHRERLAIGHDIDGLVIKPNYTVNEKKLGWNKHGPLYSQAYKFKAEVAMGILNKIRWQVSANGRLSPVGILKKPVNILGSTIKKASLGTIGDMKRYHIKVNSYVEIMRMNDVIPKMFGIPQLDSGRHLISPSKTLPKHAYPKGKYYYLPSSANSTAVLVRRWSKFVSKPCLNVMGLSDKVIKKMIKYQLIDPQKFSSLFEVSPQKWTTIPGFGQKGYRNLVKQLDKARKTPLAQVLLGLPIPNAGLNALKPISHIIGNYHQIMKNPQIQSKVEQKLLKIIPNIKGLGGATVPIIKTLFSQPILQQLDLLAKYMKLQDNQKTVKLSSSKLSGNHFVITGRLSHPRKYFTNLIKQNGGKMQSSVNGKTDYLICNQKSSSTKYRTALAKHIPIINETQFSDMLKH